MRRPCAACALLLGLSTLTLACASETSLDAGAYRIIRVEPGLL